MKDRKLLAPVYPLGFSIYPKVNGRNSFLPVLTSNVADRWRKGLNGWEKPPLQDK